MLLGIIILGIGLIISFFSKKDNSRYKRVLEFSHEQYMNKFKQKEDIIKEFGLPDVEKKHDYYVEWYYDKGTTLSKTSTRKFESDDYLVGGVGKVKKVGLAGGYKTNFGNENLSEEIIENKKFIKFIFERDVVLNWETKGVDFTSYKTIRKSSN